VGLKAVFQNVVAAYKPEISLFALGELPFSSISSVLAVVLV
jgi:BCCT family betaine/carnitine transporter